MIRTLTFAALAAVGLAAPAAADDFPERAVAHIFPWSAAGPAYAASNAVADRMGEILGQNVGLQAMTGAGGTTAFREAMSAPADGYTMIDAYAGPLVLAPLAGRADWTYEDFTPLHAMASNAFAVIVRADDDRFPDFAAFAAHLADNRGAARYSGGQDLGLPHIVAAQAMRSQDLLARHIPYTSMVDGVQDLRGGILDFMVVNPGLFRANQGEVRVIAVLTDRQQVSDDLYDGAPIITDLIGDIGVSGLAMVGWNWWVVAKDTPMDRVEILRAAQLEALQDPEVIETARQLGFSMLGFTADQYEDVVSSAIEDIRQAQTSLDWERAELEKL